MSRLYDDLKRRKDGVIRPKKNTPEHIDLFAYAAAKKAAEEKASPEDKEPVPAPPQPAPTSPPAAPGPQAESPPEPEPAGEDASAPPKVIETTPLIAPETQLPEEVAEPEPEPEPPEPEPPQPELTPYPYGARPEKPLANVLDPLNDIRVPQLFGKQRNPWLVGGIAIVAVSLIVSAVLFLVRRKPEALPSDEELIEQYTGSGAESGAHRASPARRPVKAASVPFSSLDLEVPGAKVTSEGGVKIVTFDEGLFVGGTRLGRAARKKLDAVGDQLAPYGDRLLVTVIGCTDNVPLNRGSRYEDNQQLGLVRAEEVVRYLREKTGLPGGAFKTLSYGERWTPYPNDSPANRARNRTAVLRISAR